MAGRNVTFTFDGGIEKIIWGGTPTDLPNEITVSPSTNLMDIADVYAKPIFKNGYIIDTAVGVIGQSNGVYHINAFEVSNVSFTSKLGEATMKSYDLSTSTKWDSLSAGNHSVTIVAKASGYRDSASSTAVTVVKSSADETWVLNSTLTSSSVTKDVSFKSKNTDWTLLDRMYYEDPDRGKVTDDYLKYNETIVYTTIGGSGWTDQAYRTITFDEPVTDTTLLTWLQANGTKQ